MLMLPPDYLERVYAGVLGKIIGVYMGRPVENLRHEDIVARIGEVRCYLSQRWGWPTVVTDDDIAGTFTFFRAFEDYDYDPEVTSAQIGQTWLNYIIENVSVLWWGGLYHSTEHTAFLNMKRGIPPPRSGSVALNGPVIANQIGAQIFIDAWAMAAPGDPERAARFAERAARVSHDDEAVHAARLIAALEALAFVQPDVNALLESGLRHIPPTSLISRLAQDVRAWCAQDKDWRETFARIQSEYGYKKYVGGCHIVPNHALILLGLLDGQGDFDESLAITCTCGWDVDCNAGNLGCLLGIRGGLATFAHGFDWRTPVADRMLISTADGGRTISDALREALYVVNTARRLRGLEPLVPKDGARFHFSLPGSLQGFQATNAQLSNPNGDGLEILLTGQTPLEPAQAMTATFALPDDLNMDGYALIASPTLYPGQRVTALVTADPANRTPVEVRLAMNFYNTWDQPEGRAAPPTQLEPGQAVELAWDIPDPDGGPIFEIGIQAAALPSLAAPVGPPPRVLLDRLGWQGCPQVEFRRPERPDGIYPQLWRRAWVQAVHHWENRFNHAFRIIQDRGRGMVTIGTREWGDYRVTTRLISALFASGGVAFRVQGLERFYALELVRPGKVRLIKCLDGERTLAEAPFEWEIWRNYRFEIEASGPRLVARVDGALLFDVTDADRPLLQGGIGFTVQEGHLAAQTIQIGKI